MEYVKFKDIAYFTTGKLNSNAAVENGKYTFFTCAPNPLKTNTYSFDKEAILLAGNNAEGNFHINFFKGKFDVYQRTYVIDVLDKERLNLRYLYYILKINLEQFKNISRGTSTKFLTATIINDFDIPCPNIEIQNEFAKILYDLDKKIELNNQINDNLLKIIDNLYKENFNDIDVYDKAENIADITIGKTPPRKEKECFTTNKNDMKWISISDLGKSGIYIFNTTEKLTMDSIKKYNVKVIPKGTIILSFKLTVGRIAITTENMTTNEAIAHFNLKNEDFKYYLYSYLKNFDYAKLGSTSSIATSVNSKIIKAMPIGMPNEIKINNYNKKVRRLFEKIYQNEKENQTLKQIRDTLLPKLMNGEIDLENIEI